MEMNVKLYGTLRSQYPGYNHESGIVLESDSEMNVRELIERLGLPKKKVGIVTINGKLVKTEDRVPNSSKVKVFQPLAGG